MKGSSLNPRRAQSADTKFGTLRERARKFEFAPSRTTSEPTEGRFGTREGCFQPPRPRPESRVFRGDDVFRRLREGPRGRGRPRDLGEVHGNLPPASKGTTREVHGIFAGAPGLEASDVESLAKPLLRCSHAQWKRGGLITYQEASGTAHGAMGKRRRKP